MANAKQESRTKRWQKAVTDARNNFTALTNARDDFILSLSTLHDIQQEYQEWYDNMPENTQSSPMGEKLETIIGFDLEPDENDIGAMESAIDDCEGAELPLGFGRD